MGECAVEVVEISDIIVNGEVMTQMPEDLYIPPDALRIFLEAFQGPLDLLLYLIRKQNLDILNIPIADITRQYVKYVELMHELQLELAAEYLVMAAMLAEIKSRLLLPKMPSADSEEDSDPRAELVRRLQEYERFRQAADAIDELPRQDRDIFIANVSVPKYEVIEALPDVFMPDLVQAMQEVLKRASLYTEHQIAREALSIRERMSIVLDKLKQSGAEFIEFSHCFTAEEGRMGVVVTLIAILELVRQKVLEFVQSEPFAQVYIKSKA